MYCINTLNLIDFNYVKFQSKSLVEVVYNLKRNYGSKNERMEKIDFDSFKFRKLAIVNKFSVSIGANIPLFLFTNIPFYE